VKVRLNEDEVRGVNDPATETFTLFPEMAATVYFLGEGKAASSGAVAPQVFAPQAGVLTDAQGPFVWKVVDERVTRAPIEPGDLQEGRVLIRSGLKGGERIVIDPPENLRDDLRVRLLP
jgi:multidrug efflux pump subunit AcrA (membrane-fusion protein)